MEFIKGRFKDKTLKCHKCLATYKSHEEKQTDVNIAVQIVADAAADKFDRAIIISADTDLIPAITTVHKLTPEKEIGVLFPIGRNSFELREAADFAIKMKTKHLDSCQFAWKLQVGKDVVKCPDNWK